MVNNISKKHITSSNFYPEYGVAISSRTFVPNTRLYSTIKQIYMSEQVGEILLSET
jgi:hypothetical protein